jgi:hypothetical protein
MSAIKIIDEIIKIANEVLHNEYDTYTYETNQIIGLANALKIILEQEDAINKIKNLADNNPTFKEFITQYPCPLPDINNPLKPPYTVTSGVNYKDHPEDNPQSMFYKSKLGE